MPTPDLGPLIAGILADTIWSPHFPLRRAERLASISPKDDPVPRSGGLYRIHLEEEEPLLAYVGQTGRLRGRLNELALGVFGDVMPYTTPHVAAPSLYAWALTPPYAPLMLSFLKADLRAYYRQGLESLVVTVERQRRKQTASAKQLARGGYSPLANFGKMPKGWYPSSSRTVGERGSVTLVDGTWHELSIMPVCDLDDSHEAFGDVWGGHEWTPWRYAREVPIHLEQRGLYRLWQKGAQEFWYIGCGQIASAARTAARLNPDLLFSAVVGSWTENEREELKSDLLGLYMVQRKRPPLDQYEGEENATAGSPWPGEIQQGDEKRRRVRGV
jgi:hypothetical protein